MASGFRFQPGGVFVIFVLFIMVVRTALLLLVYGGTRALGLQEWWALPIAYWSTEISMYYLQKTGEG
jgi:hypothetical protein